MTNETPSPAILAKADAFVASQRAIDPKLGAFANAEMSKAFNAGRLAAWLKEMTA